MNKKSKLILLYSFLMMLPAGSNAFAHSLWLNPSNYFPKTGEIVEIGIGWGHKYLESRTDQEVKENTVEEIAALDPDGQTVKLERESAAVYKLKVEKAGVYLVAARIKPGVFTMTPEGRKWATKKEVENPGKCTAFHISAKTVLVAGGSAKNLGGFMNQPVELVPLVDPSKLKTGTSLPVKILFQGKPLPGIPLKATYAGYEAKEAAGTVAQKPTGMGDGGKARKDEGASQARSDEGHKGGGMRYPVETVTDEQGQAIIPVDRAGFWMITLSHKPPYDDLDTCDEYMYNFAFTLQVK